MKREEQYRLNIQSLIYGYINGQSDYGKELYPDLTFDEWFKYIKQDVYNFKVFRQGREMYAAGICKDLRFLGNEKMKQILKEELDKECLI